jgi:membrane protease subunit (stomatin/prohibitin family)
MGLLIEIIEWMDPSGDEMIYRLPQEGSADFKIGAQLIVRDSQLAMFFKDGKIADTFGTGRFTLTSKNLPILTRLLAFPFGFNSPFRAEVYFINTKVFTELKWGTKHPVAFQDSKLGLIRLRGHGAFTMQITNPELFLNSIVGRQARYTTADIQSYLRDVIVARLNDLLGENLESILDLPAIYTELADQFKAIVQVEFAKYGLALVDFYIASITPPDEVAQMIDQRSGLEAVGDLDDFLKFQMAKGLGSAGGPAGTGAGMGMAAGVGLMLPGMMAGALQPKGGQAVERTASGVFCVDCGREIGLDARFCPHCGAKVAGSQSCPHCESELIPGSKYCGECGRPVKQPTDSDNPDAG